MSEALEARLEEVTAKVQALEEEIAAINRRFRKLRKRLVGKKAGEAADADKDD